jgi:hypothetical protein
VFRYLKGKIQGPKGGKYAYKGILVEVVTQVMQIYPIMPSLILSIAYVSTYLHRFSEIGVVKWKMKNPRWM